MKNLKVFLFVITGLIFASCEDAIDIKQPSELAPEDTFETVTDMQLGLNAIYSTLSGESAIIFTSIFTDEAAIGKSNGGQGKDGSMAFNLNSNSGEAASIWASNYFAINLATRLIEAAEFVVVEAGSDEETTKNNILAQAYAVRAYSHFVLLSYFSPDMTNDSALGVIAISTTPSITDKLPRNTNGEVFALIDSDLAFATENLSTNGTGAEAVINKVFFTQEAILALKARMALYRGKYDLAKQMVDELDDIFNPTPANQAVNNLSNPATYAGIFNDVYAQSNELIFAIDRSLSGQTGNWAQAWSSANATVTGSPFFEVSRSLFNLVNNATDVRKFVIADESSLIMGDNYSSVPYAQFIAEDVLPVGKYPGDSQQLLLNDIKVFRFSEMVFIRAEYYANAGDFANAIAEVNKVRTARLATTLNPASFTNSQAVWGAIMDERRAELAFEGHRYIDIKRLGAKAGKGVERDPQDCSFNGFCTLPGTDYRFTLPIPQPELAANPNIVQNPGY